MDYEKLGVFYLGRGFDPATTTTRPEPLLYASRDLTTHAMCVGMTGSGKTGLAVALLEEAAIDGIPALVIDPKGDLGNLLLAFPELRAGDFAPWVDPDEARRRGLSPDDFAAAEAATWKKGLAEWGQEPARVARYRDAVDLAVYTPGSTAGRPLAMLRSFSAPAPGLDAEALRERVGTAVSGLLGLLGIDADPLTSREHILLSRLVHDAWAEGRDLDLAGLILAIQKPGFDRLGVLDVESFFPAKERFGLAMALNNLLASPGAAAWTEGEPLDVGRLLFTAEGKPRISVVSIAHLSDPQRMFVVATLLGEVLAWVRGQSGTSSLRALLYMDEIQGFFPPTANPPSKPPMLTLLKQARAFGLGVVLSTQNPVDLDYKGLANCGTWFVGRLQTERDKARLLDGLESAAGADRATLDRLLSGLGKRVFLLHDVHRAGPELFQTRWTLSYLRGPLTREQIRRLTPQAATPAAPSVPSPARRASPGPAATSPASAASTAARPSDAARPALPPGVDEVFVRPTGGEVAYTPGVYAKVQVHYVAAKAGVDVWEELGLLALPTFDGLAVDWANAAPVTPAELDRAPAPGATYAALPAALTRKNAATEWKKTLVAWLFQDRPLVRWRCADPPLLSAAGEDRGAFTTRARLAAREARDDAAERLRTKYAPKLDAMDERRRRAALRVQKEEAQAQAAKVNTAMSFGATILGALFGKKTVSATNLSKAAGTVRSAGRAYEQHDDVGRAEEELEAVEAARRELEDQIEAEVAALHAAEVVVEELRIAPKKADITVDRLAVGWRAG